MNRIGIIGMGPRGLSVLERIAENARAEIDDPVVVHVIEPRRFGSGGVWRTDQSDILIMNIVASQITAFTDDSVRITGPIRHGPNLYEWAVLLADGVIGGDYPVEVREEAARTHANSYCRRSFYGHYLEYAYARVLRDLPHNVQVCEHNVRAVRVADTEQERDQVVVLADGQEIEVDEVVLALGHGRLSLAAEERFYRDFAARASGRYFPPSNPADVDLSGVEPGQPVLMRGLGLCFFDYVALLTAGRGGRFVRSGEDLEYLRSGDEPAIFCGSRRGLPLHTRAVNEKGDRRYEPIFLTEEAIAALRSKTGRNGVLDFRHKCWPLVAKEVETVYYTRLVAAVDSEDAAMEFCSLYRAAPWGGATEQRVLRAFCVAENERWSWTRIARPWAAGDTDSVDSWQRFLRSYLLADVREARRGNIGSPLKAGADVLRDIRNEIRSVMNNGGVDGASYGRDVEGWFNSLHAFLSIGPPLRRIEELVALMDAGVVRLAGPGFTVDTDLRRRRFVGRSSIPDDDAESSVVIDAMLPKVDLANSRNSVLTNLANGGQLTTFLIGSDSGQHYRTGGVAVTERPFHPIRTDGSHHPRRYVFGVPTEGANWVTETGDRARHPRRGPFLRARRVRPDGPHVVRAGHAAPRDRAATGQAGTFRHAAGRVRVRRHQCGGLVNPIRHKLSLRASLTGEVVLDAVRLPADAMLPEAVGLAGPLSCLNEARIGIIWGAVGAARACYETALSYARDREQFGRPIAGFQLTQHKLAEMAVRVTQAALAALRLGRLADAGALHPAQISVGKLANVRAALEVARSARTILGANGITAEYPVFRHMANLETVLTYEGTEEMHTLNIGRTVTGLSAFR